MYYSVIIWHFARCLWLCLWGKCWMYQTQTPYTCQSFLKSSKNVLNKWLWQWNVTYLVYQWPNHGLVFCTVHFNCLLLPTAEVCNLEWHFWIMISWRIPFIYNILIQHKKVPIIAVKVLIQLQLVLSQTYKKHTLFHHVTTLRLVRKY